MKSLVAAVDGLLGAECAAAGAGACVCAGSSGACACSRDAGVAADVAAGVSAGVAVAVSGASVEQLGDWLVQLQRCVDVLAGVHAQVGTVFDAASGPQLAGCPSLGAWSRRELRLSGAEVRSRAHAARGLRSLDRVRAAAAAGAIRPEHVVEFGRGCAKVGEQIMGKAQDALLPVARECDPAVLRHAIDQLHATVHPDDPDADWVKAQHKQDLTCTRVGYGYQVRGFLDADTGAMLATLLATWTRPDPTGGADAAGQAAGQAGDDGTSRSTGDDGTSRSTGDDGTSRSTGDDGTGTCTVDGGPHAPGTGAGGGTGGVHTRGAGALGSRGLRDGGGREVDDRPVARRRVEGLKTLLVAHLNAGLPSDKGIRPHLNVTVDLATLLLALGADRTSASTPPTLGGYGVTGRDLIARLACDASLSVVLTDATTDHHRRTRQHSHPPVEATGSDPRARITNAIGHSSSATGPVPPGATRTVDASVLHGCGCEVTPYVHVLDVGRAERIATPKQRLAVLSAQQHRCAAPGCVNTHLEVHHIVSWLHGGATNMDNLVGLCSTCHTLIHRGLLHCRSDAHGAVVFTRSDGTAILDVRRRTLLAYAHALRDHVSAALLTQHQHDRLKRPPRHTPRRPPRPPEAAQPQRHQHPDDQSDSTTTPPF